MVKYTDDEIEDKIQDALLTGFEDGIDAVEYRLKNKSCFYCKYGFITSDWSVGIGEHLEECKSPIVLDYRLEELDKLWHNKFDDMQVSNSEFMDFEDWLPQYCGSFELDFIKLKRDY